ncbi:MAG: hypothetical protein ACRBCI_09695 [Cellvibrionaceae bacterium]
MKKYGFITMAIMTLLATNCFADGKIIKMWFAGPDDPNHTNIVQLQIEGGLATEGCDLTYAAIRTGEDREHLISFAIAAYMSQTPVRLTLNPSDKYFGTRCTVARINNE